MLLLLITLQGTDSLSASYPGTLTLFLRSMWKLRKIEIRRMFLGVEFAPFFCRFFYLYTQRAPETLRLFLGSVLVATKKSEPGRVSFGSYLPALSTFADFLVHSARLKNSLTSIPRRHLTPYPSSRPSSFIPLLSPRNKLRFLFFFKSLCTQLSVST